MFEITLLRSASFVGMMMLCFNSSAQSYVTYNHDASQDEPDNGSGDWSRMPYSRFVLLGISQQLSEKLHRKNKLGFRSLWQESLSYPAGR
jgi:hypothetical protein